MRKWCQGVYRPMFVWRCNPGSIIHTLSSSLSEAESTVLLLRISILQILLAISWTIRVVTWSFFFVPSQPTRVAPLGLYNCFPELPSFLWLLLVRLACRKKSPSNAHPTFLSVITSYLLFASIPTSSRTASSFLVCPTRCIFNILTSASSKSLHAIYSSFSSGRSVHWNHLFFALPLVIFWLCRRCVTTTKCEALWIKERLACCARRRLSVKWCR